MIDTPEGSVSSAKAGRGEPVVSVVAAAAIPIVATSRRKSVLDFCVKSCVFDCVDGWVFGATNAAAGEARIERIAMQVDFMVIMVVGCSRW